MLPDIHDAINSIRLVNDFTPFFMHPFSDAPERENFVGGAKHQLSSQHET